MAVKKQYFIEVYDPLTKSKIATWANANIQSFRKKINGGFSECIVNLPYSFDYYGTDIAEGNDVKISVIDSDLSAGTSRVIYSGYISMVEGNIENRNEGVSIHLLGYNTMMSLDFLKSGTTTTQTFTATDIGTIILNIVNLFIANNPNTKINANVLSIPTVGQNATYTFKRSTYQEAIDKMRSLAPANYYFYVDENSTVNFKPRPTSPTHNFILGKHFSSIHVQRGVEKIKNSILLWNGITVGGIYKLYEDSNSIALYGRRGTKIDDYGISDSATADYLAKTFLDENKEPEIVINVQITDNQENVSGFGYDIESIQPGDTCRFVGFTDGFRGRYLQDNMLITEVIYYTDRVELTIDPRNLGIIEWQDQQSKTVGQLISDTSPTDYTV